MTGGATLHAGIAKHPEQKLVFKSRAKKAAVKKGHKRGGGSQRAYFHQQLRRFSRADKKKLGMSEISKRLHQEHKNLPAEELAHYQRLGRAATLTGRSGAKAFASMRRARKKKGSQASSLVLVADLQGQAEALRRRTRDTVLAQHRSVAAAEEEELAMVNRERLAISVQEPFPVDVSMPCAHMSHGLQQGPCRTYEWCAPAADLAKACVWVHNPSKLVTGTR